MFFVWYFTIICNSKSKNLGGFYVDFSDKNIISLSSSVEPIAKKYFIFWRNY